MKSNFEKQSLSNQTNISKLELQNRRAGEQVLKSITELEIVQKENEKLKQQIESLCNEVAVLSQRNGNDIGFKTQVLPDLGILCGILLQLDSIIPTNDENPAIVYDPKRLTNLTIQYFESLGEKLKTRITNNEKSHSKLKLEYQKITCRFEQLKKDQSNIFDHFGLVLDGQFSNTCKSIIESLTTENTNLITQKQKYESILAQIKTSSDEDGVLKIIDFEPSLKDLIKLSTNTKTNNGQNLKLLTPQNITALTKVLPPLPTTKLGAKNNWEKVKNAAVIVGKIGQRTNNRINPAQQLIMELEKMIIELKSTKNVERLQSLMQKIVTITKTISITVQNHQAMEIMVKTQDDEILELKSKLSEPKLFSQTLQYFEQVFGILPASNTSDRVECVLQALLENLAAQDSLHCQVFELEKQLKERDQFVCEQLERIGKLGAQ